eukprot:4186019-Lingulodinium_polyedra.AAC.1
MGTLGRGPVLAADVEHACRNACSPVARGLAPTLLNPRPGTFSPPLEVVWVGPRFLGGAHACTTDSRAH